MGKYIVVLKDVTEDNKREKLLKAITKLSEKLEIPATIKEKAEHSGEKFQYKAQEELRDKFVVERGLINDTLYSRLCATLGLPVITVFSKSMEWEGDRPFYESRLNKAIDPKAKSLLKKRLRFSPSTGQYMTDKDIDNILDAMDNFLNRNTKGTAREITIDTAAASRILANMTREKGYEKVKDVGIPGLTFQKKSFQVVSNNYNKIFTPSQREKLQQRVIGTYITDINDSTRNEIRKILVNGESSGKTNSEISQDLFDRFGSLNRDWQRIVDTEQVNIFNENYIAEQASWGEPGEKLYFKRIEYAGNNTCDFCEQALKEDVIALYVDHPMVNDEIDDPVASIAIWDGKNNIGVKRKDWSWAIGSIHPSCKGRWERYFPGKQK